MNIIIIDDEYMIRNDLRAKMEQINQISKITTFDYPLDALQYARENPVDVAFLDIEMPGMNGIETAIALKEIKSEINIVFVTGHAKYGAEAFETEASDYLLKPASVERIKTALMRLRNPVLTPTSRIKVQCFGNFEVFSDGKPLEFSLKKTKELFAYLIFRRGAWCSVKEIAAVLWEDKTDSVGLQSHLRILSADLAKILKGANAGEILLKKRGMMAIVPDKFICDMYNVIKGDISTIHCYTGEFMAQYSWAEFMNAYLDNN